MFRALVASLLVTAPAFAAPATRVLCDFDFEERSRGNVEDMPFGWRKVEGEGLPQYVRGRFDDKVAAGGSASFRVDLNGGSAIYRYPAGRIAATPGAIYRVSAAARTSPLAGARARLTAYFVDVDGHPIEESIQTDTAPPGDDRFHPLTLDLAAGEKAGWLVLELALLQPAMLDPAAPADARRLLVEDIRGSAWFDDVRVAQVPQVTLSTDQPTNVFPAGEPIALHVRVRDPLVSDLSSELRLVDVDGRVAFQRTGGVAFVGPQVEGDVSGTIELPALEPGWYEATLSLKSQGQTIGEHRIRLVRLADGPGRASPPDGRFGLVATGLPPTAWPLLPDACDRISAGRIKLAVWSDRFDVGIDDARRSDRAIEQFRRRGIALTACLAAPSTEMRRAMGGDRWANLTPASSAKWEPVLADLVARFGNATTRWQMCDDDAAEQLSRDPRARAAYVTLSKTFAWLTGNARNVAMPWPAWLDLDAGERAPAGIALSVSPAIAPEQLALYVDDARHASSDDPSGRSVSLTLFPIDRAKYGAAAQERDLALRIANALAAGADRIDLPLPMAVRVRGDVASADPEPLLPAQRTITRALSNARFVGKCALADDVDGFCFDSNGRGLMLVAMRGDATTLAPQRKLSLTLGRDAAKLDLSGRSSTLRKSTVPGRVDDVELDVGPIPFFVTDVDLPLVMLRASLALDRPLIESTATSHARRLTFRNDFDQPITGTIRLAAPKGWIASMPGGAFNLNPGETFTAPLTLTLPSNVPAGQTKLIADIRIEARDDRRLTLPVPVTVGLADVGLRSFALRIDGGDVIVQQVITNYGSSPIDYTGFAQVPGRARQEKLVSNLGPGKSVVRRYRFAPPAEGTKTIRSGLKELQGNRMLNNDVPID